MGKLVWRPEDDFMWDFTINKFVSHQLFLRFFLLLHLNRKGAKTNLFRLHMKTKCFCELKQTFKTFLKLFAAIFYQIEVTKPPSVCFTQSNYHQQPFCNITASANVLTERLIFNLALLQIFWWIKLKLCWSFGNHLNCYEIFKYCSHALILKGWKQSMKTRKQS